MKKAIVTGGGGFIGAYLVKRLVTEGWSVGVVDNLLRGDSSRFAQVSDEVEVFDCDVRNEASLVKIFQGADVVFHLAAINGTENFYQHPQLVLDVGIRGALAVVNACSKAKVYDLVVASSAEVYQTPKLLPTPETVSLMLPDSLNPRYSYAGSKIITELISLHYAKEHFRKLQIFRPHNVYGPNMGYKHVIPQFLIKAYEAVQQTNDLQIPFRIQGDGEQTRAFCYVDDIIDGLLLCYHKGGHREIYHLGNDQEISIRDLATQVVRLVGREIALECRELPLGSTSRRCPDITKVRQLGYSPKISLASGLAKTHQWYSQNYRPNDNSDLL